MKKEIKNDAGFKLRAAERNAFCRFCDETIKKGDMMVTGYSWRNKGMTMHFHPDCVGELFKISKVDHERIE